MSDLLDMAIQAGMWPAGSAGGALGGAADTAYGPGDAPDSTPPESTGYVPGPVVSPEQNLGPATQPTTMAPQPAGTIAKEVKAGTELGVSASGSGYSDKKAKQIDGRDAGLNRDLAAAQATAEASGAKMDEVESIARQHQITAAQAMADAQVAKITEEGHQADMFAKLQKSFADVEQEAEIKANALSQTSMASYMAAVADLRASKVDPSQLWGNMSGGQKFGTLASVFVHDFLGAKGIHTSAMDTLNTAIDRNIAAQVEAIKVKGEVADGFKSLWYMQRNQSASDAEARTRMRGLLLEGAKQQVIAHMSSFEAGLATAQGQAAMAEIDKEAAKNFIDIQKHIDQNALSLKQQAVTWNGDKLRAANESWANSLRAKELALQRDKFNADQNKKQNITPADIIYDPESNVGKWMVRPGTRPETVDKLKEVVIATEPFNMAVQELRDFERKLSPSIDPLVGTRLNPEEKREYHAIQLRLAHSMVKANGERATDKDVDQYLESIPIDTVFTNGGVAKILADTQKFGFVNPTAWIRQYADDIPDGLQPKGPKNELYAGAQADATAVKNGTADQKSADQRELERNMGLIHGPKSGEVYEPDAAFVKDYHEQFVKKYPEMAGKEATEVGGWTPGQVTGAEDGMAHLAITAKETDKSGNLTPAAVRARETLQREAEPFMKNDFPGADQDWRGAYAAMLLSALDGEADKGSMPDAPVLHPDIPGPRFGN